MSYKGLYNSQAASIDMELRRSANERRMHLQQELLNEATTLLARKKEIPIVVTDCENKLVQH